MLLRNHTEMRKDIDLTLNKMQGLRSNIIRADMAVSACIAAATISLLITILGEHSSWSLAGIIISVSGLIITFSTISRNKFKEQHSELVEYCHYLLSDPMNRAYYAEMPDKKKLDTGFVPKPGTRLSS